MEIQIMINRKDIVKNFKQKYCNKQNITDDSMNNQKSIADDLVRMQEIITIQERQIKRLQAINKQRSKLDELDAYFRENYISDDKLTIETILDILEDFEE